MIFKDALYYKNPIIKDAIVKVLDIKKADKGYNVQINKSLFYPEGGGQSADGGFIGDAKVLDVKEDILSSGKASAEDSISINIDKKLEIGKEYKARIDFKKRLLNTQNHSGEHIVSGIIHEKYGYQNVGFHMGDVITIDFDGVIPEEDLPLIEEKANMAIYENLKLNILYPKREELDKIPYRSKKELNGQVRIVEIPGYDICACCGTQVEHTGEIGIIKLLSSISHRSGTRIEMLCGYMALKDYTFKNHITSELSRTLSTTAVDAIENLKSYMEELHDKDMKISMLNEKYFALKAKSYEKDKDIIIEFENDLNNIEIRKFSDYLLNNTDSNLIVVLSGNEDDGYNYVMASNYLNINLFCKNANKLLNGRGGGRSPMVQGSFKSTRSKIEEDIITLYKNENRI